MKKMNLNKWNLKTWQIITIAAILLGLVIIIIMITVKGKNYDDPVEEYVYTVKEQALADEVIVYLQSTAGLGERVSIETANEAVESCRLILKSDVKEVNDDHTQAIQD